MQTIRKSIWNADMGSTFVDWCVLGAGVASLAVALVTTVF